MQSSGIKAKAKTHQITDTNPRSCVIPPRHSMASAWKPWPPSSAIKVRGRTCPEKYSSGPGWLPGCREDGLKQDRGSNTGIKWVAHSPQCTPISTGEVRGTHGKLGSGVTEEVLYFLKVDLLQGKGNAERKKKEVRKGVSRNGAETALPKGSSTPGRPVGTGPGSWVALWGRTPCSRKRSGDGSPRPWMMCGDRLSTPGRPPLRPRPFPTARSGRSAPPYCSRARKPWRSSSAACGSPGKRRRKSRWRPVSKSARTPSMSTSTRTGSDRRAAIAGNGWGRGGGWRGRRGRIFPSRGVGGAAPGLICMETRVPGPAGQEAFARTLRGITSLILNCPAGL